MAAKHISRRFARQAKRQFKPLASPTNTMPAAIAAPQAQIPAQPNAVRSTNASAANTYPSHYIRKYRVGGRTVSQYISARDGASDMRLVDMIFRQAALHFRSVAKEFITTIKLLHIINESTCNTIETEVTAVLNGLGYHRVNRGPWRKARVNPYQHRVASRAERLARMQRGGIPNTQYHGPSPALESLAVLVARLDAHITECRKHATDMEELFNSIELRARSKTAVRLCTRYAKRAQSRLDVAEKTLALVRTIWQRESRNQPE